MDKYRLAGRRGNRRRSDSPITHQRRRHDLERLECRRVGGHSDQPGVALRAVQRCAHRQRQQQFEPRCCGADVVRHPVADRNVHARAADRDGSAAHGNQYGSAADSDAGAAHGNQYGSAADSDIYRDARAADSDIYRDTGAADCNIHRDARAADSDIYRDTCPADCNIHRDTCPADCNIHRDARAAHGNVYGYTVAANRHTDSLADTWPAF